MKSTLAKVIVVLLPMVLVACGSTHKVNEGKLTGLALQQLQTRHYEAEMKVAYASVLSVLQDAGYIVESADSASGLVTAKSPTESNLAFNFWYGFQNNNQTTRITAFVEPIGAENSKVRVNFVAISNKTNLYGANNQVDTPLEDPKLYENIFEKIGEAIFIRQSM